MEYLEFFHLKEDPFRITPDPGYYYASEEHDVALKSLNYSIAQDEGFCLITGEPGTGKTLLVRMVISEWIKKANIALIMTPRLLPEEFLRAVLEDLGVSGDQKTKHELLKTFRDYLLGSHQRNRKVIILVDEAQQVPDSTLEEIRLLSNLETETQKLLHIILVGQEELKERLKTRGFRQLYQRITVKAELSSLSLEEVREYVAFRLGKAGRFSPLFKEKALKALFGYSSGVPRLINVLCSRALMAAYLEGKDHVERHHIKIAAKDLGLQGPGLGRARGLVFAGLGLLVTLLGFWLALKTHMGLRPGNAPIVPPKGAEAESAKGEFKAPEAGDMAFIREEYAGLRAEPNLSALEVMWASKGQGFRIEARREDGGVTWYRVRGEDGNDYWVLGSDLVIGKIE